MKNFVTQFISRTLIISMLSMSIWMPSAQASIITTQQITDSQTALHDRERVRAFFDRADVQAQLQARGVDPQAAKARVNALTDNEVASINGQLDNLPAGGMDILGFFLFIFIVLLITDILGFTHVFSFTRHR